MGKQGGGGMGEWGGRNGGMGWEKWGNGVGGMWEWGGETGVGKQGRVGGGVGMDGGMEGERNRKGVRGKVCILVYQCVHPC